MSMAIWGENDPVINTLHLDYNRADFMADYTQNEIVISVFSHKLPSVAL